MVRISESHIRSESVRNNLNFKYKTVGTDDVDFWIVLYFWISCVVVAIFWKFLFRDPDIFFQMFLDKSSEHFRISVPVQRFPKMLPKKLLFISHILVSMNSDVRCKGIGIMERLFTEFALVWGFFCMDTSHVSSFLLYFLSHWGQAIFFSISWWVKLWPFRLINRTNDRSQGSHLCNLICSWVIMCDLSAEDSW